MPRVSPKRRKQGPAYARLRAEHLWNHPLCQITIALERLDEPSLVAEYRASCLTGPIEIRVIKAGIAGWTRIDPATQIHHRNKSNGDRYLKKEFFMSAGAAGHDWAERHKDEARRIGVLCPINARPDGSLPDGGRCLTTDELLAVRARGETNPLAGPESCAILA